MPEIAQANWAKLDCILKNVVSECLYMHQCECNLHTSCLMHMNSLTHAQGYIQSIEKVIYAFYQQFLSTLKIISAACNIFPEQQQASKQGSVINSTRRDAHDSAGNAQDFTNPKNNHHDKLEEFRLHFWKGKEKRDF